MTRCTLRRIFTVLIYAAVGVFLFPYLTGHLGHALSYLLIGISLAVVFGILRCTVVEGDCTDPEASIHPAPPDTPGSHIHS
jgi:hypothetical protein